MGFWVADGAWVFLLRRRANRRYPLSWFTVNGVDGPMTSSADRIKVGGEVGSGLPTWPSMGSGLRAEQGYLKAAYHRRVYVIHPMGVPSWSQLSEPAQLSVHVLSDIHNTTDPDWSTYLYYGGNGSDC